MWSESYHLTEETSRFILSTGENLDGDVTSEPRIPGAINLAPRPRPRSGPATSYGPNPLVSVTRPYLQAYAGGLESYRRLLA